MVVFVGFPPQKNLVKRPGLSDFVHTWTREKKRYCCYLRNVACHVKVPNCLTDRGGKVEQGLVRSCLGYILGEEILPRYIGMMIHHIIRIPIKQPL